MTTRPADLDTSHLKGLARKIADDLVKHLHTRLGEDASGGGCKAFYSAQEWDDRGRDVRHRRRDGDRPRRWRLRALPRQ